jgi:hypothetical protein
MATRSRKDGPVGEGVPLPADLDLETLYGAGAVAENGDETDPDVTDEDDLVLVPPVRLAAPELLAEAALAAPLIEHTMKLARWVGDGKPVDEWGELSEEQAAEAAAAMGVEQDDVGEVERAWALAVDLELIVLESGADSAEDAPERGLAGPELARLEAAEPEAVLDAWLTAASVIAQTAVEAAIEDIEAAQREDADEDEAGVTAEESAVAAASDEAAEPVDADDESEEEYARLEEAREEAQGLLDDALQVLYETRALAPTAVEQTLPLGVLAALLVVPEGEDPTEELLGEITETMVLLDPMLQELADLGILDYRPIDPSLFEESEDDGDDAGAAVELEELDPEEVDRFGHVRLTDLGLFGVREWLLEDGIDAPLVGAHAQGDAAELLRGICESANVLPEEEIVEWLEGKEPQSAAAELLAAARGDDLVAPVRRLYCQVALRRLGEPAVPAVREVLGDPELVGIAGAWLTELGATDLPQPERATVLWTTVDALAAQLIDTGGQAEAMRELVEMLPGPDGPDRFFEDLWRVDHTYTRAVLEAVGELHPDKSVAKMARKAAYKAKSQGR